MDFPIEMKSWSSLYVFVIFTAVLLWPPMEYNKKDDVDPKLLSHPLLDCLVFFVLVLNLIVLKSTTSRKKVICSIFNIRVKEKKKRRKKKKNTSDGTRTRNLRLSRDRSHLTTNRRPTPYPLGHGGGMFISFEKVHYECQLDYHVELKARLPTRPISCCSHGWLHLPNTDSKTVSRVCRNLFCSFSSRSCLCSIDFFSTNQGIKGDVLIYWIG